MKKLFFFCAVAAVALLASCSVSIISSSAPDAKPNARPIITDLEVRETKVSATYTSTDKWLFRLGEGGDEQLLRNAVYQALSSANADVLVGMQYQITEEKSRFTGRTKSKTVNVSGYPAFYRNMRALPNNELIIDELKPNTPYVVTEKDGYGESRIYTIIMEETNGKNELTIDLDGKKVDTVVLTKDGKKRSHVGDAAVIESVVTPSTTKSAEKAPAQKPTAKKSTPAKKTTGNLAKANK